MNWGIYCRISIDTKGEGVGVERQERACREFAEASNLHISEVYKDNDISAYSGKKRPAYERLLKDLELGTINGVVCWHVDRLYRRSRDLERLVDIVEKTGAEIRTIKAGDLDLNTATGRMMARIVATISSYEVDHQIERQKASCADRAARGKFHGGTPPYGYRAIGDGHLEIVEHEAAIVRDVAASLLAGQSLMAIRDRLNAQHTYTRSGKPWRAPNLRTFVLNPATAGYRTHKGEIVGPGVWEAILPEDEWRAVTALLTDPTRRTQQGTVRKWQGAGVYRCGLCGAPMYTWPGGNGKRSYACKKCGRVVRNQEKLDAYITEIIVGYLSRPENQLAIVAGKSETDIDLTALISKRSQLAERKAQLGALFATGVMNQAQVIRGNRELDLELKKVDRAIQQAREHNPVLELVLTEGDLRKRWPELSADQRAEVIRTLIDVRVMPGKRGPKFHPELIEIDWK